MDNNKLPLPLAVILATQVKPQISENGETMGGTADDEDSMGNTTYTDDFV